MTVYCWWAVSDSNGRPSGCKPDALTAELTAPHHRTGSAGHRQCAAFLEVFSRTDYTSVFVFSLWSGSGALAARVCQLHGGGTGQAPGRLKNGLREDARGADHSHPAAHH